MDHSVRPTSDFIHKRLRVRSGLVAIVCRGRWISDLAVGPRLWHTTLAAKVLVLLVLLGSAGLMVVRGRSSFERKTTRGSVAESTAPRISTSGETNSAKVDGLSSVELADRLDALGLWRDLDQSTRAAAHQAVAAGAHPWSTEISPTVQFFADGEELAEDGVQDFLTEISPAIKALGVDLEVMSELRDEEADSQYIVTINGREIEIYDGLDAFKHDDETFPWFAAQIRPLARVNELLAEVPAKERFFVLYPGANDSVALLIDPEIVAAVAHAGFTEAKETPLLAK